MLSRTINSLTSVKSLSSHKNVYQKILNVNNCQQLLFYSAKPRGFQPLEKNAEGAPLKKPKTTQVPKITLIAANDGISVTTLEEAQHLAQRRDLKLIKIVDIDAKTQRPVYKLMTGAEYHAEDLKRRDLRRQEKQSGSNAMKGEKLLMLSSGISNHDLETNVKRISKWIAKRYEVRVVVSGCLSNMEKAENIYKFLEGALKDETRFLQKRAKGNDLKFQIIPPKEVKDSKQYSTSNDDTEKSL